MSAETSIVLAVQRRTIGRRTLPAAALLSRAREHAAAWIAVGLLGAAVDSRRRREWAQGVVRVLASHGSSVVLKRLVRRVRPGHPALALPAAVAWSRVALGVHFPSDVPSGIALGTAVAALPAPDRGVGAR